MQLTLEIANLDARIWGNIVWRLQGNWSPRNQFKANLGPDPTFASGSLRDFTWCYLGCPQQRQLFWRCTGRRLTWGWDLVPLHLACAIACAKVKLSMFLSFNSSRAFKQFEWGFLTLQWPQITVSVRQGLVNNSKRLAFVIKRKLVCSCQQAHSMRTQGILLKHPQTNEVASFQRDFSWRFLILHIILCNKSSNSEITFLSVFILKPVSKHVKKFLSCFQCQCSVFFNIYT